MFLRLITPRSVLLPLLVAFLCSEIALAKTIGCADFEKLASAKTADSKKLKAFMDTAWDYGLQESPMSADYLGMEGDFARWTDLSTAAIERRQKVEDCQLQNLLKINRRKLTEQDQINFDLYVRDLKAGQEGRKFHSEVLVLSQLDGPHTTLVGMLENGPKQTFKHFDTILRRLELYPEYLEQITALLRDGLKRKITTSKKFVEKTPAQMDRILNGKLEDGPLFAAFKEFPTDIYAADRLAIQTRAKQVLQAKIIPALQSFRKFVVEEYIPNCRESYSVSDLPNGKEWYAFNVKETTHSKFTPQQLHELGLSEVARIEAEMAKVREKVGFKGDRKAFHKFLLTDDRFFYKDGEALLNGYRQIGKRIDPELIRLFKVLPRMPYGVKAAPEHRAIDAPTGYYESGNMDSGMAANFVANTVDLRSRPIWGMEALTAHEAVPGHHLQISLTQEIEGQPKFRKYYSTTSYSEGWGLYAESLGYDLGLYKDPYSQYGQLAYELWRAVRLVVDTGIHDLGWSRDKAIDYFGEHLPKSAKEAEVEVDRYCTWPGQALAYKVGQLKFNELKERARKELGEKFDIREFHYQVLRHGGLPWEVLETQFNAWLASAKKAKPAKA